MQVNGRKPRDLDYVGKALRRLGKSPGWLARECKVSRTTGYNWAKDSTKITGDNRAKVESVLQLADPVPAGKNSGPRRGRHIQQELQGMELPEFYDLVLEAVSTADQRECLKFALKAMSPAAQCETIRFAIKCIAASGAIPTKEKSQQPSAEGDSDGRNKGYSSG